MTARTRQAALCMEAAERDLRASTWDIADRMAELSGVTALCTRPEKITRKVAQLTRKLPPLTIEEREQAVRMSEFINSINQYTYNPAYRDRVDRERAARQAEVYARMDAAIARYRSRLP